MGVVTQTSEVFSLNYDFVLFSISIIGLTWYLLVWTIGLVGCIGARRRYRLRPRSPLSSAPAASVPGVSILRPLKGLDINLYENLESTFKQEYANYEILFSVASERDQALPIVRELMNRYPNIKTDIIIGEEIVGVNPKVNNLIRSYRKATNDILWVIDSNVTADPGTLARSVDILINSKPVLDSFPSKQVALVHHVPFASVRGSQIGSRIEEAFLNTNHAKMYIAINAFAVDSCVVGKSNLYRRSDLERVNGSLKPRHENTNFSSEEYGLHTFGRFLAEDNMIGSALWHELGLRHDLSCDVAHNVVGNMTLSDYVWRRVRWIRVRKHMALPATCLEPFTESVMLFAVLCFSSRQLYSLPLWILFCLHFVLWLTIDLDVYASLANYPIPTTAFVPFLTAWAIRELIAFPVWLVAMAGDEVVWRGKRYQARRDGCNEVIGQR